jgi:hypothetical protein
MESHDEERLMFKNLTYGNSSGNYNIKDIRVALNRMKLAGAFFFTIPGPKMIWQFGELAYDSSINFCQNGTISGNCRTDPKPIRWGYFNDPERRNLYNVVGSLNRLRNNTTYSSLFTSNNISYNLSGYVKTMVVTQGSIGMVVMGNFDVATQTASVNFPFPGVWYNYLNPGTIIASGSQSFSLAPGEYRVYINQFVPLPVSVLSFTGKKSGGDNLLKWIMNNEQEVISYELERSTDGKNYTSIASITEVNKGTYQYLDAVSAAPAVYFYRVRILEQGGNYRYSDVVKLAAGIKNNYVEVMPNPVGDVLHLSFTSTVASKIQLTMTDMKGRTVLKKSVFIQEGNSLFHFPEMKLFSAGIYVLNVTGGEIIQNIKVIKAD